MADLTYRLTVRLTENDRSRLRGLIVDEELDESTICRLLLQCGLAVAERDGLAAVVTLRRSGLGKKTRRRSK